VQQPQFLRHFTARFRPVRVSERLA
jgi:hypothetical protein